jgi:hypothetical protein
LVIYRLLEQALVERMQGTIVAVPALNPVGLRSMQREPYHSDVDPNRLWPDGKSKKPNDPDQEPPSSLEQAYQRLFDIIVGSADAMIDFHAAWTGSIPFAFRDRLLYRQGVDEEKDKAAAEALSQKQYELLQAFGHTIILEMPITKLLDDDLERSASGSVLYVGKIPAFTVELGTGYVPDPSIVAAAVAGTRNVMRRMGMLDGEMEPIQGVKVLDLGYPMRRCATPRVKEACIVEHLLQAGEVVKAGQAVARIMDIWGRPLGEGLLKTEYDGFVIGRTHGIYHYSGAPIYSMAIPNDAPLVLPYPGDYFPK